MLLQIVIFLLANVFIPAFLLYRMWKRRPNSKLKWLLNTVYTGIFLTLIFLVGRWDWIGYYFRYVLLLLYIVIGFVTCRRVYERPFFDREGRKWWKNNLGAIIEGPIGIALLAFVISGYFYSADPVQLTFPLQDGSYVIGHGGNNFLINYHNSNRAQAFALDVLEITPYGFRAQGLLPDDVEQYEIFGETIVSPCDGTVESAVDGLEDQTPPERDTENITGNHVVISCRGAQVLLAHMRKGSLEVSEGESVTTGQPLGEVGNSGNTTEPHLHIHAVAGEVGDPLDGRGVPMTFEGAFPVRNMLLTK
jgi:hypothetical protein